MTLSHFLAGRNLHAFLGESTERIGPLTLRKNTKLCPTAGVRHSPRLLTVGDDARIWPVIPDSGMNPKQLESRASAPAAGVLGLPRILEALLSLRYHRYSEGWKSAAKDLLFTAK
jgi:hypothetical protein